MPLEADLQDDVSTIARIAAIPTILDVVCRTTGMGFAAVARVTEDRWIACSVRDTIAFGLQPGGELKVETTICNEIRGSREPVVIDQVAADAAYCDHPVPALYGFQSYVSFPIILPDGAFFGTLCAIDPGPARVNTPETIGMFKLFAELIAFHLDAHQRVSASEASLLSERESADLREQFIAVLGHDLRNPLAAIQAGTQLLLRTPLDERATVVVGRIQNSVDRMARLIENVLDFARGRLGGGLALQLYGGESLEAMFEQVVAELRATHPERVIATAFSLPDPVRCDTVRMGQLLSNLLGNALTHGAADAPVRVEATTGDSRFELSVANRGEPIPPAIMEKLFQPFFRAAAGPAKQGLGLGLYIAGEIARAHGGTLDVASSAKETRFTFRMPLG